jgi:septal ring factor EnvC (AmiA/AmiB activator)
MRKILLTITAIGIFSVASFAQAKNDTIQQLQTSIEKLEGANIKLSGQLNTANSNIQKIEKKLSATADSLNILKNNLANTNNNLQTIADNLGVKIQQTSEKASADLSTLNEKVGKNTLYWIIAVLFIALLSVLLFGWLKKQLSKEKTGLSDQIKKTSETLRDEQIKLDGQLIKLLDTQMQLMNAERQTSSAKAEEVDHSLALKVADEIIRIHKNLSNMDSETKGLKQLSASVERIQDNFKANGYEMIDMLNKPYDQGMKVSANFRPDENLKQGEQVITRIIKPQVNFKGVMIQAAQVEVSVGE